MINNGSYVRFINTPKQMGTVYNRAIMQGNRVSFQFDSDERLVDKILGIIVSENELEECERPNDIDINELNTHGRDA